MRYFTFLLIGVLYLTSIPQTQAASSGWLVPTGDVSAWDDFSVLPASYADKYRAVDESVCNGTTDGVWTAAANVNDKQAFTVDLTSVPNGTIITGVTVRPCMSANDSVGSSTIGVRINLDGIASQYQNYIVLGDTPTVQSDSFFGFSSSSPTITKSTTTELMVGFKYLGGAGARVSHVEVDLSY